MNTHDQNLVDQANKLIDDMLASAGLMYRFNNMLSETDPDDLEDFADSVSDWISDQSYQTDWDTFCDTFKEREAKDLRFWSGTYYLATPDNEIHRMKISKARKQSNGKAIGPRVYLNNIRIKTFEFQNKVLTWDLDNDKAPYPTAKLSFSNYMDQQQTEKDGYSDSYCQGEVTLAEKDAKPLEFVGKINVHSYQALTGGYSATDALSYWAGIYGVMTQDDDGFDQEEGELTISQTTANGEMEVALNGKLIQKWVYNNNQLSWAAKVDHVALNDNTGVFRFTRTADRKKVMGGKLFSHKSQKYLTAGAYQTQKPITAASDALEISTAKLPARQAGEKYEVHFVAKGGKEPYVWSFENLPSGFNAKDENLTSGLLSGKPDKAGLYAIGVTVTDSEQKSDNAFLSLEILESNSKPVESVSSITNIATSIISSLLAIIGVIILIHNKKTQKDLEERKRLEAGQDMDRKERRENQLLEINEQIEIRKEERAEAREQEAREARAQVEDARVQREEAIMERLEALATQQEALAEQLKEAEQAADDALAQEVEGKIEENRKQKEEVEQVQEGLDNSEEEDGEDGEGSELKGEEPHDPRQPESAGKK